MGNASVYVRVLWYSHPCVAAMVKHTPTNVQLTASKYSRDNTCLNIYPALLGPGNVYLYHPGADTRDSYRENKSCTQKTKYIQNETMIVWLKVRWSLMHWLFELYFMVKIQVVFFLKKIYIFYPFLSLQSCTIIIRTRLPNKQTQLIKSGRKVIMG